MAKLNKKTFSPISSSSIQDPVVFVVDMISGFIEEGALHDKRIRAIVPAIQKLLQTLDCPSTFVCDQHDPDAREFQSYPTHCVNHTRESEIIDALKPYVKECFFKNSTNTFFCSDFSSFLSKIDQYKDIVITGCCTDLCILQFALSLNAWLNEHNKKEHRVLLPIDCVETYDIPSVHEADFWNKVAIENMVANGIVCVSQIME